MRPSTEAIGGAVWALLVLVGLLSVACADNPTSSTGAAGTPATINLAVTLVGSGSPPTASIVATVRDSGSLVVPSVAVKFSTTSGFITAGGLTGADGVVVGLLTGSAGTSPTVTASVTTVTDTDTQTITANTVVQF